MLAASTAFPFTHGSAAREDTPPRLYKSLLFLLTGVFKTGWKGEWEEEEGRVCVCNSVCWVWTSVCICAWKCFWAVWLMCRHAAGQFGHILGTMDRVWQGGRKEEVCKSHQKLLRFRKLPVNHSASPSSAHSQSPSAASLWNHENPSLPSTKIFAVSLYLPQRSKSLCLHLLSPYVCHHIQYVTKSFVAFDFAPFSCSTC